MPEHQHRIRAASIALVLLASIGLTSCVNYKSPSTPWIGGTFMNIEGPVDLNATTSTPQVKVGKSSSKCVGLFILPLIAWGDASVSSAARKAGITKVEHIDYRFFNAFGCFQSYETIVTGE